MRQSLKLEVMVDVLKAAAEQSRFRILILLYQTDLTVSDLTEILGQSQPRVSRHLKLLLDAGLITRYQEGSWAFFRLSENENSQSLVSGFVGRLELSDPMMSRDLERLDATRRRRQEKAAEYFSQNASSWDEIRSLHVPDAAIESELKSLVGNKPFQSMVDLGTGTGRLLELFAPLYRRGLGVDLSREMLAVARANLDRSGISHAQVRLGDLYTPPVDRNVNDLVTMHQVLHYLDDPALAINEAARLLRAGGRLVIVDFAPHGHDFLREEHAHLRLGFSDRQIGEWLTAADLELEDTRTIVPSGDAAKGLTVKLWLARDRRIEIAITDASQLAGKELA